MSDAGPTTRFERSDFGGETGRGVRVAVIDSGVHPGHPHVPHVMEGVAFDVHGKRYDDFVDRLGHGTAVAAAICEKAPEATLHVVKVFDRELSTPGQVLVAAFRWVIDRPVDIVNLSLGTLNDEHEPALAQAIADGTRVGITVVAAAPQEGRRWLPGALPGVVAVELDWTLPRDACELSMVGEGTFRARASGYPRPIPGLAPDRNLKGLSFAVANVTGLLALARGAGRWPIAQTVAKKT